MRISHRSGWILAAALVSGCGGLEPVASYSSLTDPAQLFMSLELDHAAVNLATVDGYRELQLTATPLDALGRPMSGLPAATFRSSDTTRVFVTRDGLLQARRGATAVQVIAEVVAPGNIRQADTLLVNVRQTTTAPPVLDVLTLRPENPADAILGMTTLTGVYGSLQFLIGTGRSFVVKVPLRALDVNGNPISGLIVEYESLHPDVILAHPRTGIRTLLQQGEAAVVARTTAYGVVKADTAHFTVTMPVLNGVYIEGEPPTARARTILIRPGGYAFFTNFTAIPMRVTFENPGAAGPISELCEAIGAQWPAMCDSGNIPDFTAGIVKENPAPLYLMARGRQFKEPGEYPFRIEPLGVTGTVVVADEAP